MATFVTLRHPVAILVTVLTPPNNFMNDLILKSLTTNESLATQMMPFDRKFSMGGKDVYSELSGTLNGLP